MSESENVKQLATLLQSRNQSAVPIGHYLKRLEILDKELQRVHSTVQILTANRESIYSQENFLKELQGRYSEADLEYQKAIARLEEENEQRKNSQSASAQ